MDEPLESSSASTIDLARRQTAMMSPAEPKVTEDIACCYTRENNKRELQDMFFSKLL